MYKVQFEATSSADWTESIELIDADTNHALDVPEDAEFELTIGDRCWSGDFTASTGEGNIIRPADNVIQWRFPRTDLNRFWPRNTYSVGLTMTTAEGTIQLFVGTLTIIDGVV